LFFGLESTTMPPARGMRMLVDPLVTEPKSALHRAYYSAFVLALVVCFSPLKILAYAMPTVFVLWIALAAPNGISRNRLVGLVGVIVALPILYELAVAEFLYSNYLLAIVTYSAFLPIILVDARALASRELFTRMLGALAVMVGLQGTFGILQAVYGAMHSGSFGGSNGDLVMGTIFPHFYAEGLGANPMFAVNMSLMLVACLAAPGTIRGLRRQYLTIGAVALVLASVMHVLIYLVAAVVTALFLTRRTDAPGRRAGRTARGLLVLIALVGIVSYVALPDNVARITSVVSEAVNIESVTPRMVLLLGVATELPDDEPVQPYIGLGPGQFSSRASLIGSGLFLGGLVSPQAPPFLEPKSTLLAESYCFTLLRAYSANADYIGSSQQPFFSFLSIYTELGLFGLGMLVVVAVRILRRIRVMSRKHPEDRPIALALAVGVVLVLLLGLQENYWEMPQALLVGLLVFKVAYANLAHAPARSEP